MNAHSLNNFQLERVYSLWRIYTKWTSSTVMKVISFVILSLVYIFIDTSDLVSCQVVCQQVHLGRRREQGALWLVGKNSAELLVHYTVWSPFSPRTPLSVIHLFITLKVLRYSQTAQRLGLSLSLTALLLDSVAASLASEQRKYRFLSSGSFFPLSAWRETARAEGLDASETRHLRAAS